MALDDLIRAMNNKAGQSGGDSAAASDSGPKISKSLSSLIDDMNQHAWVSGPNSSLGQMDSYVTDQIKTGKAFPQDSPAPAPTNPYIENQIENTADSYKQGFGQWFKNTGLGSAISSVMEHNPQKAGMALNLLNGKINAAQVDPSQIPWDYMVAANHTPIGVDNPMSNLAKIAANDPAKARELLSQWQKSANDGTRQNLFAPSAYRQFWEHADYTGSFGASPTPVAPRTTGEAIGEFGGDMAAMLPQFMTVGGAVEGGLARAIPALAGDSTVAALARGVIGNGITGGLFGAAKEASRSHNTGTAYDWGNVGEEAGTMAAFSLINPLNRVIGANTIGRIPGIEKMLGAAENVSPMLRNIITSVPTGAASAFQMGFGTALTHQLQQNGLDLGKAVRGALGEAGNMAGQELVSGIVDAIMHGTVMPTRDGIKRAADDFQATGEIKPQMQREAPATTANQPEVSTPSTVAEKPASGPVTFPWASESKARQSQPVTGDFVKNVENGDGVPTFSLPTAAESDAAPVTVKANPNVQNYFGERPAAPINPAVNPEVQVVQRQMLVDWLGKKLDTVIDPSLRGKALGEYNAHDNVVRTKMANDLPILAHEIGHRLDKAMDLVSLGSDAELTALGQATSKKNYTADMVRKEGVGEFMRLYLSDPVEAQKAAPGFYQAFEQKLAAQPDLAKVIKTAQEQISAHLRLSPEQKLDAATAWNDRPDTLTTRKDKIVSSVDQAVKHLTDEFFDSNAVLKEMGKELGGKDLPVEADPYLWANVTRKTMPGQTEALVREWQDTVMQPLNGQPEDVVKHYLLYADARAAVNRAEQFGYDETKLPGGITPDEAKAIVAKYDSPEFQQIFTSEQGLYDKVLGQLKEAGILDDEAIQQIKAKHPDYEPFYRDMGNGNGGDVNTKTANMQTIKSQHGSARDLMDPIERRIKYFANAQKLIAENSVRRAAVRLTELFEGGGHYMVEVPTPMEKVRVPSDVVDSLEKMGLDKSKLGEDATVEFFRRGQDKSLMSVYIDGKERFFKVNDDRLMRVFAGMQPDTSNMVTSVFEAISQTAKTGATITPSFTVANLLRDTTESYVFSHNQQYPGQALVEAIKLVAAKDPMVQRTIDAGLKQGGFLRPEEQSVSMLREIAGGKDGFQVTSPKAWWQLYQRIREEPEYWTRLGEASLEYKRQISQGASDSDAFVRALFEGQRITLNFERGGYTSKRWNKLIPFFKIPFEAGLRTVEASKENPGQFYGKMAMIGVSGAVMTILANRNNKQYLEASDSERDRYWMLPVPGTKAMVRVPKPNGIIGIMGNVVERSLREWMLNDPDAWHQFASNAIAELSPRVQNPIVTLMVGYLTNQDITGDGFPVVPEKEQSLPAKMQYGYNTSGIVRKTAGAVGLSPRATQWTIEKALPGYSEGIFKLEQAVRQMTTNDVPAAKIEDWPVMGRFISRPGEGKQGNSVSMFYDMANKADTLYKGLQQSMKNGTAPQFMSQLSADDKQLLLKRSTLSQADDLMGRIRKQRDAVIANPHASPEAKAQALSRANNLLTLIAERTLGR